MIDNYLLFATPLQDIEEAKRKLEGVLDIQLELVNSSVWGKYYGTSKNPHIDVVSLFPNWLHEDDDFMEPDYSEYPLLISVYDTDNQSHYLDKILGNEDLKAVLVERIEHFDDDS